MPIKERECLIVYNICQLNYTGWWKEGRHSECCLLGGWGCIGKFLLSFIFCWVSQNSI